MHRGSQKRRRSDSSESDSNESSFHPLTQAFSWPKKESRAPSPVEDFILKNPISSPEPQNNLCGEDSILKNPISSPEPQSNPPGEDSIPKNQVSSPERQNSPPLEQSIPDLFAFSRQETSDLDQNPGTPASQNSEEHSRDRENHPSNREDPLPTSTQSSGFPPNQPRQGSPDSQRTHISETPHPPISPTLRRNPNFPFASQSTNASSSPVEIPKGELGKSPSS